MLKNMISPNVRFIISTLSIVTVLFACSNSSKKGGFAVQSGKITISSTDSLRSGLNFLNFEGLFNPLSVKILQQEQEVPISWRGNFAMFPLLPDIEPIIQIDDIISELPYSKLGKLSLVQDSTWIAVHSPRIGTYASNALVFNVYDKVDNKWVPRKSAIRFQPWMNMGNGYGHGSQYNIQPEIIDTLNASLQRGTVMFSMPGMWELRFIVDADTLKGPVYVTK
jgi:hypothetical protein